MASPQSKSRYIAALRDQPSPTERGRSKVLGNSKVVEASEEAIPIPRGESIVQKTNKSRIVSRWQVATQNKFHNAESDDGVTEQDEKPIGSKFLAKTAAPPPPPPLPTLTDDTRKPLSARRSRLGSKSIDHDHSVLEPPSLKRTNKNWDAEKEIPPGTVTQSPFQPKKDFVTTAPAVHPPHVERLKKQWDAKRDIPKGTVQARQLKVTTDPSDREGNDTTIETLKKLQWDAERDIPKGAVTEKNRDEVWSPRSTDMDSKSPIIQNSKLSRIHANRKIRLSKIPVSSEPDVKAADFPNRQWNASEEIPKGVVVEKISSGRIFFPDVPNSEEVIPPQLYQQ